MGLARYCDRCGKLYHPEVESIRGIPTNGLRLVETNLKDEEFDIRKIKIDLCPDCLKSFEDWLEACPYPIAGID